MKVALVCIPLFFAFACGANSAVQPSPSPSPTEVGRVPKYLLNPNVTQSNIKQTICVPNWTDTVRPPSSYTNALKRQQLPKGAKLSDYEEDHYIALSIGGAPKEPRNLWPETWSQARLKDKYEVQLHKDVCAGKVLLINAQQAMYERWQH